MCRQLTVPLASPSTRKQVNGSKAPQRGGLLPEVLGWWLLSVSKDWEAN